MGGLLSLLSSFSVGILRMALPRDNDGVKNIDSCVWIKLSFSLLLKQQHYIVIGHTN
jgi:hypothetical protein